MTANFQEAEHGHLMLEYLKNVKQPGLPLMVMEYWTGWFDHWGEGHQVVPTERKPKMPHSFGLTIHKCLTMS